MDENKDMHDHEMMEHMEYTCSMHPEEVHDHPGNCSICGMALVPKGETMMNKTMYTCSMHPEEMHDHPGVCSVCGMTLVPSEDTEGDKA
jgi:Cu+-exporting ATPase